MKRGILFTAIVTVINSSAFATALDPLTPEQRHQQAYDYRESRAAANRATAPSAHKTNTDESNVANFQAQFHKTLPHDANGIVDAAAYNQLLDAIATGSLAAFDAVPSGGPIKLANPLGGQVYDLEGRDSHDYGMRPAPSLGSAETAADMVEVYQQALTRDVNFSDFGTSPLIKKAAGDLAALADFKGPINKFNLFRGIWDGEKTGPYISQFLYLNIPYGPKTIDQKYVSYQANQDFMTSFSEWLAIQNGQNPSQTLTTTAPRYILNGRDLGYYVHKDFS